MGVRYRQSLQRLDLLRRELAAVLPRLIDAETEQMILFGSVARGTPGSTSDLDLLGYPNGLPGGIPADAYMRTDAERAPNLCARTVDLVTAKLGQSTSG
jgi:predicted nucleotidyltransferase